MDGYKYSFNNSIYPSQLPITEPIEATTDLVPYVLSQYFTDIINNYMSKAFASEAAKCGLYNNTEYMIANGSAIGDFVNNPLNPQLLTTTDYTFPLCSLYRESEEYHQISLVRDGTLSHFVLHYVFPPLNQDQYNRLYNFLGQLSKAVLHFGFQGNDPLYLSGASILAQAGISFITWQGSKYDPIVAIDAKGNGLFFPTISIRFTAFEQEFAVAANYEPIGGVDIVINEFNDGYSSADGYNNLAVGSINAPVSITSFSPSSGTKAGGQWIAISGHGFLGIAASSTLICNVPVTQQIIRTDNLMLVQTGTSLQVISGLIQLTDILGTQYFSSTNYSYT